MHNVKFLKKGRRRKKKKPLRTKVEFHVKRFQSPNQADLNKANEVSPFYLRF